MGSVPQAGLTLASVGTVIPMSGQASVARASRDPWPASALTGVDVTLVTLGADAAVALNASLARVESPKARL